jgi:amidase
MVVHPACAAAVHVAGALLDALGHPVDIGWPAVLDHLWSRTAASFSVVSDAVRPPVVRWVSDRLGRPVERGELADVVFDAATRAATRSEADVQEAHATIDAATAPILHWWNDYDLLVTPTTFQPAWPLGGDPGPREMGTLLAPFSLTGQPSISLPLHHTDEGLPVGVQFVARPGGDEILLRLAEDLQAASDWTVRRPPSW